MEVGRVVKWVDGQFGLSAQTWNRRGGIINKGSRFGNLANLVFCSDKKVNFHSHQSHRYLPN